MHLQNYTCSITANLDHNQIGPIQQTTFELQGELLCKSVSGSSVLKI